MRDTFSENVYVYGCNPFGTASVDGDNYPASGSFIDVSGYERFVFLIHAGTLTTDLVCTVQEANAINGTPASVSGATLTIGNAAGDNDWYSIEVETARLTKGKHFVSLDVAGGAGSDDFLDVIFLGLDPKNAPVTQHANYLEAVVVAG